MRNLIDRYRPVFNTAGEGAGGDGGGGAGGWTPPQGLPSEFSGSNADEVLGKLLGGYTQLNTRAEGLRTQLAQRPAAPEKADLYTFDPADKLKPYFGDLSNNPLFGHARNAAHKHGMSQEQFAGFISETYGPMVDAGLLPAPFDPSNELKSFMTATGLDQKATQETLTANETFAKGFVSQLKGIPDGLKADVEATLLGLTDTAVGNVLLQAMSGRLSESGIRVSGEGGGLGELTADDLKKLDSDPRIDPRNRDHKDPAQRYDPELRKKYDAGYNRHFPSR